MCYNDYILFHVLIPLGDEVEFSRAVLQIYKDELIWNKFSKRGLDNIEGYLSVKNEASDFETMMRYIFG